MKIGKRLQAIGMAAALAVLGAAGCLQPDPAGSDTNAPGKTDIPDPDQVAGATSSTNWPIEDAGDHPIEVSGTADSVLDFSFVQSPYFGVPAVPIEFEGSVRLYRAGVIPIFDSVPTVEYPISHAGSFRIAEEQLKPLITGESDTLRITVEFRKDTARVLLPGFVYSMEQHRFLSWPPLLNTGATTLMRSPHFMFAGLPDSAFHRILSDTTDHPRFYYYIPGSPYFWEHALRGDSLYIGPTVQASLPLRCVKVTLHANPEEGFSIEVYPLSLKKESVYDSIRHVELVFYFKLGDLLLRRTGRGNLSIREP